MFRTVPTEYREGYRPNLVNLKNYYRFTIIPISDIRHNAPSDEVYVHFFHIYARRVRDFMNFLCECSRKKWDTNEEYINYVGKHEPDVLLFIRHYDAGIYPTANDIHQTVYRLEIERAGNHRPDIPSIEDLNADLRSLPSSQYISFSEIPEFRRHAPIISDNLLAARSLIIKLAAVLYPKARDLYGIGKRLSYTFFFQKYLFSVPDDDFENILKHGHEYLHYDTPLDVDTTLERLGEDFKNNDGYGLVSIKYILYAFITETTLEEYEPYDYRLAHINREQQQKYYVENAQSIEEYVARQRALCNYAMLKVVPAPFLIAHNLIDIFN